MQKTLENFLSKKENNQKVLNKLDLLNEVFTFIDDSESIIKETIIFNHESNVYLYEDKKTIKAKWKINNKNFLEIKKEDENIELKLYFLDENLLILKDIKKKTFLFLSKNKSKNKFKNLEDVHHYLLENKPKSEKKTKKNISLKKDDKSLNIFFNSLIFCFLSFFILLIINQLVVIFSTNYFEIPYEIYFIRVFFLIPPTSDLWTPTSIIIIYGLAPFISLILGILFYRLHIRFKDENGTSNLFLIWLYLHSFNFFFGAYLAGLITKKGFNFFFTYLYFPHFIKVVLGISFFITFFLIGNYTNVNFLQMSVNVKKIKDFSAQLKFKWQIIFAPILILFITSLFFSLQFDGWYERILLFLMFTPIFLSFKYYNVNHIVLIDEIEEAKNVFLWKYLIILTIIVSIFLILKF